MAKDKKYTTAATRFFGIDETVDLDLEENSIDNTNDELTDVTDDYVFDEADEFEVDSYDYDFGDDDYDEDEDEYDEDEEYYDEIDDEAKKKKIKLIAICAAAGAVLVAIGIIIFMANQTQYINNVEIYVDGVKLKTFERVEVGTLEDEIIKAGYDEENYKENPQKKSTDNKVYLVQKKLITVTDSSSSWDKEEKVVYQYTLDKVLSELKLDISEGNTVYVDNKKISSDNYSSTTIRVGSYIKIDSNKSEKIEEEIEIPFTTKKQSDSSIAVGSTVVQTAGENGIKKVVYHVTYVNDVEIEREIISSEVVKEPVTEVILIGTKEPEKPVTPDSGGDTGGDDT